MARLFVILWIASAVVLGAAFFLPIKYEAGYNWSAPPSSYEAQDGPVYRGHFEWYGRSFSTSPTSTDVLVFFLPFVLAVLHALFRGKGRGAKILSAVSSIVLLVLLVVLGFKILFFDFDLFSGGVPPRRGYGGVCALGAMAACFILAILAPVARLKRKSAVE